MPRLVQTSYYGQLHHSIEYGPERSSHLAAPLGTVTASVAITPYETRRGIDAVVRQHFPEALPPQEPAYHGA